MNIPDSAITYYQRVWGIDSTDSFSAASLINLYLKSGKEELNDAITYSELYIARDSTHKQINILNGLCYYASDLYQKAIEKLEKCYATGDSTLIVSGRLGISYYSLNLYAKAHPFLVKAYKQDSTNNNVLYCLANISNEISDHKSAVKYFTTLIRRVVPADLTLYLYYRGLGKGCKGDNNMLAAVENLKTAEKYAGTNLKLNLLYDMPYCMTTN
jgi:tetratricopeptide (TPR) repeat protein